MLIDPVMGHRQAINQADHQLDDNLVLDQEAGEGNRARLNPRRHLSDQITGGGDGQTNCNGFADSAAIWCAA